MFRVLCLFAGLAAAVVLATGSVSAAPQYSRVANYNQGQYGWDYDWRQGDPNRRVCCQRQYRGGYQDWWSSAIDCQRAGGYATANKVCRKHKSDPPPYGNYQQQYQYNQYNNGQYNNGQYNNGQYNNGYGGFVDPYGNPDRRVCCYRDGRAWWSSWIDCRRAWGQDTANKVCRH